MVSGRELMNRIRDTHRSKKVEKEAELCLFALWQAVTHAVTHMSSDGGGTYRSAFWTK